MNHFNYRKLLARIPTGVANLAIQYPSFCHSVRGLRHQVELLPNWFNYLRSSPVRMHRDVSSASACLCVNIIAKTPVCMSVSGEELVTCANRCPQCVLATTWNARRIIISVNSDKHTSDVLQAYVNNLVQQNIIAIGVSAVRWPISSNLC